MLRRMALVRTDVSEELSASFIRVTRIGELETTQAVTINCTRCEEIPSGISSQHALVASYSLLFLVFLRSMRQLLVTACVVSSSPILVTLMKEALSSSEMSVLTRATRRNIPEDTIPPEIVFNSSSPPAHLLLYFFLLPITLAEEG
jgi:hypothetical protein